MRLVSVNIGSNVGDREAYLRLGVAEIERLAGVRLRVSSAYESEPWGFRSENAFRNVEAEFLSDLAPEELLRLTQAAEAAGGDKSHRDTAGGYADRRLDIDIICIGDEVVDTPELRVPHPLMHRRLFVLRPLNELSPQWRHPLLHKTAAEMIADIEAKVANTDE